MIAPLARDEKEFWREPFPAKPACAHQRDRGEIRGLNVRFQSMEVEVVECMGQRQRQACFHVALIFVRHEGVETQECTRQRLADDIADVDRADHGAVCDKPNEEACVIVARSAH